MFLAAIVQTKKYKTYLYAKLGSLIADYIVPAYLDAGYIYTNYFYSGTGTNYSLR